MKDFWNSLLNHLTKQSNWYLTLWHFLELNPLYIIRYEDMINDAKNTYEGIFKFLLEIDNIEGTNAQRRVEEVVKAGRSAT